MIQRRAVAGIACAAATLMLGACGFEAPAVTVHEHSQVQADDFSVGPIRIRDAFITPGGTTTAPSPALYLVVTFVNDGTANDTLTGVTTSAGTITLGGSGLGQSGLGAPGLVLLPGVPVAVGDPSLGIGGTTLTVAVPNQPGAGTFVPVTFTFTNAGPSSTVQVPIVPAGETTAPTQPVPTAAASVPTEVGDTSSD